MKIRGPAEHQLGDAGRDNWWDSLGGGFTHPNVCIYNANRTGHNAHGSSRIRANIPVFDRANTERVLDGTSTAAGCRKHQ
jgi:hypothetical protein